MTDRVAARFVSSHAPVHSWAGRSALVFVLLTLATLVLVPILVQRQVESLRTEIEASEPARTLVARLRYNLVREMAALTELVLRGDTSQLATYASSAAAERAILDELAPLVARLGPDVVEQFEAARTLAAQWHAWADDMQASWPQVERLGAREMARRRRVFDEALTATAALDATILRTTARTRERITSTERGGLQLTVMLGLLALLAAMAAAALYMRVQRFAAESERRREEAERALEESARADAARIRLLRGITHDVKNPLGAARGYAELLALGVKAPLHPEQAPLVEGVQRSIDGALEIIADLLDVARAESRGLTVHLVPIDLAQIARNAAADHSLAVESAGHTLHVDGNDTLIVRTDPVRVRQVLDNLLSNAIKYTPAPGRITIRTGIRESDIPDGQGWAVVEVEDSGPGIPAESREAIFDEFTRLDEHTGMKGHGLGLAIARRIARLLDGDLALSDAPPPGATFFLRLPYTGGAADAGGQDANTTGFPVSGGTGR